MGAEYLLFDLVSIRLGFIPNAVRENFTTGLGVQANLGGALCRVDYALQNHPSIQEISNRFTVGVTWRGGYTSKKKDVGSNAIVRVKLKDGSNLVGILIRSNEEEVTVKVAGYGEISAPRDQVENVEYLSSPE